MSLIELAAQYRDCAARIKSRLSELGRTLRTGGLSDTEKYLLRGRIRMLASMERDLTKTAIYMERYYKRGDK